MACTQHRYVSQAALYNSIGCRDQTKISISTSTPVNFSFALIVLAVALVSALPAVHDESILGGDVFEAEVDSFNPQDPQAFLKLKKLKKLLFLG
uniref:Uncharacterized protein n=1 Tax=Anopheles atroparvus TaxID=41427 RepID=A0A182IR98_ANOAO